MSLILAAVIASGLFPVRVAPGEIVQSTPAESVVVTVDGEEWCVYDEMQTGAVMVVFDTRGTASIYDDAIIAIF